MQIKLPFSATLAAYQQSIDEVCNIMIESCDKYSRLLFLLMLSLFCIVEIYSISFAIDTLTVDFPKGFLNT